VIGPFAAAALVLVVVDDELPQPLSAAAPIAAHSPIPILHRRTSDIRTTLSGRYRPLGFPKIA
jgi:hypothetical protein